MSDAERLKTATDWIMRLNDPAAQEADLVEWVHWCEADARNQDAFDRMQQFWRMTQNLEHQVADGELLDVRGRPVTQRSRRWIGPRTAGLLAFAAVLLLAVAMGLLKGPFQLLPPSAPDDSRLTTAAADAVHEALLSDGSRMQLAAKSVVAVHYTEQERALELQTGEAYFTVTKNAHRPFVVTVGPLRVRALGTAFNIRRAGPRIVVTVTQGTVEVYQTSESGESTLPDQSLPKSKGQESAESHALRISAGDQVSWAPGNAGLIVTAVDSQRATAWREGRLEYTDEPLSAVIADLNRYSKRPVIIRGGGLDGLRFSGNLLTHSTDEWLRALPTEFPVRVREEGDVDIIEPKN